MHKDKIGAVKLLTMKIGGKIQVRACKTDGTVYRSWHTLIESIDAGLVVTVSPAGDIVEDLVRIKYQTKHMLRSYYWLDKFYNLIEVFDALGNVIEIYINIASPPTFENGVLSFKDHELDVSKIPPDKARLIDEDEFLEAIIKYNYTKSFQEKMYAAAKEALELADQWVAGSVPVFGENHVE